MPLKIKYSVNFEKQRIKNALQNLSWYKKFGYHPRFPKGVVLRRDSLKKIFVALLKEYNEKDYIKSAVSIEKKFSKTEKSFYCRLEKLFGKKTKRNYKLFLTKYGVGGSYIPPDKIVINISSGNPVNTIFHEIVHLAIQPYIQKYKINQNEKERIVDLIMAEIIGRKKYQMQKRGEKYKFIDSLFKKYFHPQIEEFFKIIKKERAV